MASTDESLIVSLLDAKVAVVVNEFMISPLWELVDNPASPLDLVIGTLREIYWEIHCYQPYTTKAGFAMIGALGPEHRKLMRALLLHKWEEVEHRVWALDGYKALGGDQSRIGRESEYTSPGAFAVAAVWEHLAMRLTPAAYLGAEYLFEDLTARLTNLVIERLSRRSLSVEGLRFIKEHATEDKKHAKMLKVLITELGNQQPHLTEPILFAFDCFHQVYPLPLWISSYKRAREAHDDSLRLGSS